MTDRHGCRYQSARTESVEVIAHAGGAAHHPANSRAAMEAAIVMGVDRLECDVQCSADGQLVLHHDRYLACPAHTRSFITALTARELRCLVPGLLTLDELAEIAAGRAPLLLDVKGPGYEDKLVAAIRRHQLESASSISTTYASTLYRMRRAFPTMRLGLSTGHLASSTPTAAGRGAARWLLRLAVPIPLVSTLHLLGLTEVMLHHAVATRPLVALIQRGGRRVNLWTVDEPRTIRRALGLGVNGIISNDPWLVQTLIETFASDNAREDHPDGASAS